MLLLLHSAFILSMVKIALKGEIGGCALNSHEITLLIMENHGKIIELYFCGNPVGHNYIHFGIQSKIFFVTVVLGVF